MKSAILIKQSSPDTAIYQCDPPMVLVGRTLGAFTPTAPFPVTSAHVAIWSGEVIPGVPTIVAHECQKLQGEEGFGYGGGATLVGNYLTSAEAMLLAAGYTVSSAVPQA